MSIAAISNSLLPISSALQSASASSTSASTQTASESQVPSGSENATEYDFYTGVDNLTTSLSNEYLASLNGAPSASENTFVEAGYELAQSQTITANPEEMMILEYAMGGIGLNIPEDAADQAWSQLATSVADGDLSGAQTALTNYIQALPNSNYNISSLTAPTTQFMSDLSALGTAIQGGDLSQVQAAYQTAALAQPNAGTAQAEANATGNIAAQASMAQEFTANMTDMLEALGYTSANAAIEANTIEIAGASGVFDEADGSTPSTSSDLTNLEQTSLDLAQAIGTSEASGASGASATDDLANSVYTALFSGNVITSLSEILAGLNTANGTGSSSGNDNSITTASPVNAASNAGINTYA